MGTIRTIERERGGRDARPFSVLAGLIEVWCQRRRQRLALSRLDRRLLDDIGLTAEGAGAETRKPFWRA